MRSLLLTVGLTVATYLGGGEVAHAQNYRITPGDWDRVAGRYPPCTFGSVPSDSASYVTWSLRAARGARLSLPGALHEVASPERGERHWMAPDSSRLALRVLSQPMGAMAVGGSLQFEPEGECALPVAGHRALVTRFRLTDTLTKRVRYAAVVDAFVRPGFAFSASVESPAVGTRDAVIRALRTLTVPADKVKAPGA